MAYKLEGSLLEVCNCEVLCPCWVGVDPDNGIGDLYAKIKTLPEEQRKAIEADIQEVYKKRPPMAMVNSDKGITNLHVPSDVMAMVEDVHLMLEHAICERLLALRMAQAQAASQPVR